ncbi:hypothetical protein BDD12DRAFT_913935 [Trichophaea hybrida]|nr:hypothetical protein BDD12DRAFT_913935 [Trichophaea hybrida]
MQFTTITRIAGHDEKRFEDWETFSRNSADRYENRKKKIFMPMPVPKIVVAQQCAAQSEETKLQEPIITETRKLQHNVYWWLHITYTITSTRRRSTSCRFSSINITPTTAASTAVAVTNSTAVDISITITVLAVITGTTTNALADRLSLGRQSDTYESKPSVHLAC